MNTVLSVKLSIIIVLLLVAGVVSIGSLYYFQKKTAEDQLYIKQLEIQTLEKKCLKSQNSNCWKELAFTITRTNGLSAAYTTLARLQKNVEFQPYCHGFTHEVGHAYSEKLYSDYKRKTSFVLPESIALCGYGFFHGLFATITKHSDIENATQVCRYVQRNSSIPSLMTQCHHGIGHALFLPVFAWEDVSKQVKEGVRLCELLPSNVDACVGSLYDTIFTQPAAQKRLISLSDSDAYKICEEIKIYKPQCSASITSAVILPRYLVKNNHDSITYTDKQTLLGLSDTISDEDSARIVVRALMIYFLQFDRTFDKQGLAELCNDISDAFIKECLQGVVYGRLLTETDPSYTEVIEFCSNELLSKDQKSICKESLIRYSKDLLSEKESRKICTGLHMDCK